MLRALIGERIEELADQETAQFGCPVRHFEVSPAPTPGRPFFNQLDEMRRRDPVFRSDEAQGYWVLTRYSAIVDALNRPDLFSNCANVPTIPNPDFNWIPVMLDPPQHMKWRQLLLRWFTPKRVESLEVPIRERCRALIAEFADSGSCDFLTDFAVKFPTSIFLQIIGLPVSELPKFLGWVHEILHVDGASDADHSGMSRAMGEIREMFAGLLAERRADPSKRSDDIISASLDWRIDGEPIPDNDWHSCMLLLFLAGLDTVAAQLCYTFKHLATRNADRQTIVADEARIPGAVEELLRANAIVRVGRKVTTDVEFQGCPMKAGDMLYMPLAFASRDEDVFENATGVDIDRPNFVNPAFGAGPHRCLGANLARRELIIAVEEWHRRIPNYRITDESAVVEHSGLGVYGLDALPLSW